mmetsp:Transcript_12627/g.23678  ORF Transcript_12627/g.23678 Transcript_12627/m.23678 type:complete len:696 (-) Transcript_12627:47-2134(-)|eukprot:CAMPEP_0176497342 /NCGR_PEP_ID=MMETSP0200_2-20121128/11671_1 /TAXON_ID=947934 /ORGANISM="Chaetoceros sp., Strain GSL56" /LENGTH=695 /DNA_ID=CAMNT_0017895345 /DNA_START=55 /DNA_END=2142 /DNA_ORIENTATION=+
MGKRNTAKTGDKALYKSRDKLQDDIKSKKIIDDDDLYNEVDRYNNAKDDLEEDMLRFGQREDDSEDDEEGFQNNVEGVFDLGLDQSEDESQNDDSEDESSTESGAHVQKPLGDDNDDEEDDYDDDDDSLDDIDQSEPDLLNWGKRKRDYYHGDTADLEIMDEHDAIEDAELEEEGAKEILKSRMQNMREEDFMLDDDDSDHEGLNDMDSPNDKERIIIDDLPSTKRRKLSQLSKKDQIKLMSKTHPELLPLVSHFRDEFIGPCTEKILPVVNALTENEENAEAVGSTSYGLQYIITKAMIQASAALNVCQYLMIKAKHAASSMDEGTNEDNILGIQDDEDNIKNHTVIQRLNQLNQLSEKLESKVESKVHGLDDQVQSLVKASELMKGLSNNDDDDDDAANSDNSIQDQEEVMQETLKDKHADSDVTGATDDDDDEVDDDTATSFLEDEDEAILQRRLMNEARFALRKQDEEENRNGDSSNKMLERRRVLPAYSDFGDDDDANEDDVKAAGKTLASTINRISQRSKTTKSSAFAPEDNDALDDEELFRRGIEMMENELGGDDDDEDGEMNDAELDADSLDDDEDNFYNRIKKKSKAKKEFKKSLYAVVPKYPVIDEEIVGERAIGSTILKNRGLVAHKSKLNRNPRVKKREQYRKALIKRKGAVREVRTDEGHKYGGETTGIKAGLSRSRKLGVK